MQFNEEIILKGLNLANFDLKTHQLIDSTNDECKRISSNKDILVVTADKQTKGKGRKGKKWHSPEGNISLSIAFADREFDVPISIATGILVKDALTEVFNDINGKNLRDKIINKILLKFEALFRDGLNDWKNLWNQSCIHNDAIISVARNDEIIKGKYLGINDSGELLLEKKIGDIISFSSGEVSIKGIYNK